MDDDGFSDAHWPDEDERGGYSAPATDCLNCGQCESCIDRSVESDGPPAWIMFQQWAQDAVCKWDGQSNADLMELVRDEFGQTIHQFYGTDPNGDTWRELARCRELLAALRDDVKTTLGQLDALANVWGDEGVFRRCRDRLRNHVG